MYVDSISLGKHRGSAAQSEIHVHISRSSGHLPGFQAIQLLITVTMLCMTLWSTTRTLHRIPGVHEGSSPSPPVGDGADIDEDAASEGAIDEVMDSEGLVCQGRWTEALERVYRPSQ